MKQPTLVVAKAFLFDQNGQTLLIRRSDTDERRPLEWDMPGGMVEDGENYQDAVAREIQEETGIKLAPDELHVVWSDVAMRPQGNVIWLVYVGRIENQEPKLSFEHDKFEWVSPVEAISMIEYDRQKRALQYVVDNQLWP